MEITCVHQQMNGYEDVYVYIYNSTTRRMDSFSILRSRSILYGNMDGS